MCDNDINRRYAIDRIGIYGDGRRSGIRLASIIHGFGTYGGFTRSDHSDDQGLLEVSLFTSEEPAGYLDADDVFKLVAGALNLVE